MRGLSLGAIQEMNEYQIEQAFVRWCKKNGILCLKLVALSRRGFPDRTLLLPHGVVVFLEFKQPKGRVRAHQKKYEEILKKLGFAHHYVRSVEEAKEVTKQHGNLHTT